MNRQVKNNFTPAEYLAMEHAAESKSEYYNGKIFAMVGCTTDHSEIAGRLITVLNQQIDGKSKPCHVYTSDARLFVKRSGLFTYPDAIVVCGKIQYAEQHNDTIMNPLLIVEVISESTRAYDRGAKFNFYKQIPSLQEYVVVESEQAHVEVYRRAGDLWTVEMIEGLEASLKLAAVECEIPLAQIYAKASWRK
ncbi:MAG: Uma2 family endonuclease [Chloroflexi bacterium]|nr:Uma2 family endonuclease [Chloroflexota bacterium]